VELRTPARQPGHCHDPPLKSRSRTRRCASSQGSSTVPLSGQNGRGPGVTDGHLRGIAAPSDLETGRLGPCAERPSKQPISFCCRTEQMRPTGQRSVRSPRSPQNPTTGSSFAASRGRAGARSRSRARLGAQVCGDNRAASPATCHPTGTRPARRGHASTPTPRHISCTDTDLSCGAWPVMIK
jgi:hypothetical protein